MRRAKVYVNKIQAGYLIEKEFKKKYMFEYLNDYNLSSVSLTMPHNKKTYEFENFPPFFDGLLPEGNNLEALLKNSKIDRDDLFTQLVTVGHDLVGNVTVEEG